MENLLSGVIALAILSIIIFGLYLKERRGNINLTALYEKAQGEAIHDPLTGLFNRRHLEDILDQEVGRASRYNHNLVIMFVDLDKFKIINDTLGHKVGDKVLKKVGGKLKQNTRQIDFVARHGGDEFVVLLPETSVKSAKYVAEKLIKAIEAISIENSAFVLSASIGIYQFDSNAPALDLVKEADEAMYEAKNGGRGKVSISTKSQKFLA